MVDYEEDVDPPPSAQAEAGVGEGWASQASPAVAPPGPDSLSKQVENSKAAIALRMQFLGQRPPDFPYDEAVLLADAVYRHDREDIERVHTSDARMRELADEVLARRTSYARQFPRRWLSSRDTFVDALLEKRPARISEADALAWGDQVFEAQSSMVAFAKSNQFALGLLVDDAWRQWASQNASPSSDEREDGEASEDEPGNEEGSHDTGGGLAAAHSVQSDAGRLSSTWVSAARAETKETDSVISPYSPPMGQAVSDHVQRQQAGADRAREERRSAHARLPSHPVAPASAPSRAGVLVTPATRAAGPGGGAAVSSSQAPAPSQYFQDLVTPNTSRQAPQRDTSPAPSPAFGGGGVQWLSTLRMCSCYVR